MGKKKSKSIAPTSTTTIPSAEPVPITTPEKLETIINAPEIFALPHPNEDPAKLDAPFRMTRRMLLDIVSVMLKDSREEGYSQGYEVGRRDGAREALSRAVETLGKKKTKIETATAQTQTPPPPLLVNSVVQCSPIDMSPGPTTSVSMSALPVTTAPANLPSAISQDPFEPPLSSQSQPLTPILQSADTPPAPTFNWADDAHSAALNNPPKYTPRDFSVLRSDSPSNPFASLRRRRRSPKFKHTSFACPPQAVPVFSVPTSISRSDKMDNGSWIFIPSSVLATVLGYDRRRGRRHFFEGGTCTSGFRTRTLVE